MAQFAIDELFATGIQISGFIFDYSSRLGTPGQVLTSTSSGVMWQADSSNADLSSLSGQIAATGTLLNNKINSLSGYANDTFLSGNGVTNYVPRWNGSKLLITGSIYDNGTNVGIGTISPTTLLSVGGPGSTTAASGLTFGADNSANLYRLSTSTLKTDGNFTALGWISSSSYIYATTYLQAGNGNIYPGSFTQPLSLNVGNLAGNDWGTGVYIRQGTYVGIGTTQPTGKLHIVSSVAGETVLRADGTNGILFSVNDDLSDSLMSVNNSAGLPVLEVFADDRVVMGQYGQNDFVLINNKVGIGTASPTTLLSVGGAGSTAAASGLTFGGDAVANLYRISSSRIKTDGSLEVAIGIISPTITSLSGNIAATGSTLDAKINTLSGYSNNSFATILNLAATGSVLDTKINTLSGYSNANFATILNLAATGSTLDTKINTLSGYSNANFATITNLAATGSVLDTKINTLSGYSNSTFATVVNLAATGSTLNTKINTLSGYANNTFLSGVGVANYIPRWSTSKELITGSIYDIGTAVGIGTTSPAAKLQISKIGDNGSNGLVDYGIVTVSSGYATQATLGAETIGDGYSNLNLGSNIGGVRTFWHISKRLSSSTSPHALQYFYYNGSTFNELFTFATGGSLGIGSNNPAAKLDIRQSSATTALKVFTNDTTTAYIAQFIGYDNTLGDTTRMVVQAGGNVGIGTLSPSQKLQIVGSGTAASPIVLQVAGLNDAGGDAKIIVSQNPGASDLQLLVAGTDVRSDGLIPNDQYIFAGQRLNIFNRGNGSTYNTQISLGESPLYGGISFSTAMQNASAVNRMYISPSGNIGINTTSPTSKLNVVETTATGTRIQLGTSSESTLMNSGSTVDLLVLNAPYGANSATTSNLGAKWGIKFVGSLEANQIDTIGKTSAIYAVSEDTLGFNRGTSLAFYTNQLIDQTYAERMRIYHNGNIGIGTTSPNAKLYVSAGTLGLNQRAMFINADITTNTSVYTHTLNLIDAATDANPTSLALGLYSHVVFRNRPVSAGSVGGILDIYTRGVLTDPTVKMTVTDVGNVGIGTTNPLRKLHITSSDNQLIFISGSTAGTWMDFQSSTSNLWSAGADGTNGFAIFNRTTNSNAVTVANGGNVGIGTTNPAVKLHITNSGTVSSIATVRLVGSTGNNAGSQIEFYKAQTPEASIGLASAVTGGLSDDLILLSANPNSIVLSAGASGISVFKADGKVGIGTINPQTLLSLGGLGSTSAASGLTFGGDAQANLYRSAEDTIRTDGSLVVNGNFNTNTTTVTTLNINAGTLPGIPAGSTITGFTYAVNNGNVSQITFVEKRFATGGDWTTATTRIQKRVDVTDQAYIEFNPSGASYGMALGVGANSNVEALRILSNGSIGIGTTNPATKLHVYGAGGGFEFGVGSSNCYIEAIDRANTSAFINTSYYTRGTGYFAWYNGSYTERMRIASNGNVGINSTAPTAKLSINKGSSSQLLALDIANNDAKYAFYVDQDNNNSNSFSIWDATNSHTAIRYLPSSGGYWQIYTNNVERIRINSDGYVGIATTNPAYKLDVTNSITSRSAFNSPRFSSAGTYVYGVTNSPTWVIGNGSSTNNNATAPDGTTSAGTYTLSATSALQFDLYLTISGLTNGRVYTVGMWVKLGTATNFCLVVNNSQAWNTIGGKAFTSSDGLSTSKWTHISYTFAATASGAINLHLGYHLETGVTQQTAGTVFLWNIEMTEFSSTWIGNVEDEIRLPGSSIWTSRGNVGIGTTNPTATYGKLSVAGGIRILDDNNAKLEIGRYSSAFSNSYIKLGSNSNSLRISNNTDAADIFIIENGGNVGIGTVSPATLLSVGGAGSTAAASGITFGGDAQVNLYRIAEDILRTDANLNVLGYVNAGGYIYTSAYIQVAQGNIYPGGYTSDLNLNIGNIAANNWETAIKIKPGSYVGIGTTNPTGKLHVVSSVAGETVFRTDGTNGTLFSVVDDLSDSLMSVNNSAGLPVLEVFADDRVVAGQYGSGDFVLVNNKVGIGTSNPSYKLDVNGSLGINASTSDTNWPFVVSDNSSAGSRYGLNKAGSMGFNNADNYAQLQLLGTNGAYIDFTNSVGGDSNARLIYYAGARLDLTYGFIPKATISITPNAIGIGTTNPLWALDVSGTAVRSFASGAIEPGFIVDYASSNGYGGLFIHTNGVRKWRIGNVGDTDATSPALYIWQEGVGARMYFRNNGNVGIATTIPIYTLDVSGTIRGERYRGINSLVLNTYTTVNPASNVFLYSQANDRDSWIYLDSADTSSNWGIYHRQIDSAVSNLPANSIGFIGGGTSTLQSYISLTNGSAYFAGSVGIGTVSPTNTLQVNGQIAIKGSESADNAKIYIQASDNSNRYTIETDLDANTANDLLVFRSNTVDNILVIKGDGNVGIGTTNPDKKLTVIGTAYISGLLDVSSAGATSNTEGIRFGGDSEANLYRSATDTIKTDGNLVVAGTTSLNGHIYGQKTVALSTASWTTVLTVNMLAHNSCYVKIGAFGDWGNHSAVAFVSELFIQNGDNAGYGEPGTIITAHDNTRGPAGDKIDIQIVDPAAAGTQNFLIQLKLISATSSTNSSLITYHVMGQQASVT